MDKPMGGYPLRGVAPLRVYNEFLIALDCVWGVFFRLVLKICY